MTTQFPHEDHTQPSPKTPRPEARAFSAAGQQHPAPSHQDGHEGHGARRWLMIACCIPMLLVVAALVISGVAGSGAILFAVICLAMMWLMMLAMPGGHH